MLKIVLLIVITFMISHNSHAMKRKRSEDIIAPVFIGNIPPEILEKILEYSTLNDLQFSFVNWQWYRISKYAFKDFTYFQKTYHKLKNKDDLNLEFIVKKLRKAELKFKDKNRSNSEMNAIAQAFLVRNKSSLKETIETPFGQLYESLNKNPEKLLQLALISIWEYLPSFQNKGQNYDGQNYYDDPHLKILAPSDVLAMYFTFETDFETKYKLAMEMCERGLNLAKVIVYEAFNKYYLTMQWDRAAKLYEIAFKRFSDWLPENYLFAAYSNYMIANWKKAAELYEIALEKEPGFAKNNYIFLRSCYDHLDFMKPSGI